VPYHPRRSLKCRRLSRTGAVYAPAIPSGERWYFCSAGSRHIADEIHGQPDHHPDRDFIELERFEELGLYLREQRQVIPALPRKWKVQPSEVLVDYTAGTKTMSAGLVVAATEVLEQFSYVGGEQRESLNILAHGVSPIGVDGFEAVKKLASELLVSIRPVRETRSLGRACWP